MTFPYVAERVDAGQLTLHGAYFGVATGILLVRDPENGSFAPAASRSAQRDSV
jgi:carbonic anhydrase